jgi:hypothetical protein
MQLANRGRLYNHTYHILDILSLGRVSVFYLANLNLFDEQFILNPYEYHNLKPQGEIIWDENWNIIEVKY